MSDPRERLEKLFSEFGEPGTFKIDWNKVRGPGARIKVADEIAEAPKIEANVNVLLEELEKNMQAQDRLRQKHKEVRVEMMDGAKPDIERLKELVRKKADHLDFLEKYGAGFENPQPPFKMRLVYNGLCQRDFECSNGTEMVFNLFACCQELLDDYEIKTEPEAIELFVWRNPWKHPKAESRVHPVHRDPNRGMWIPIMTFKVQEETPFFSFEELELAHQELWRMVPEYARRKINPCSEIPLVEQKLGNFLPMQ